MAEQIPESKILTNNVQNGVGTIGLLTADFDLYAMLQIILRRRWIIIATFFSIIAIGIFVTLRTTKIYRAEAQVVIDLAAPEVLGDVHDVYNLGSRGWWNSKEYFKTQYNVIRSRPVVMKAISTLGLSPAVLLDQIRKAGPTPLEARTTQSVLLGLPKEVQDKLLLLGIHKAPSREALMERLNDISAVQIVSDKVSVVPVQDSRLVIIAIEDTNPVQAALLSNAITDAYIDFNLEQKVKTTSYAVDWLSDQVQELKKKLNTSELALHQFKEDNSIISVSMEDKRTMMSETLSQLNRRLSETHTTRLALESRQNQLAEARERGELPEFITEVISNSLVQDLKAKLSSLKQDKAEMALKYTSDHPKLKTVQQKLEFVIHDLYAEVDKIISSLEKEYDSVLETEKSMKGALNQVKGEALKINKKEIEYNRLKRERDNNQTLHDLVIKRQKEADLTRLLKVNNVRKLEAALPPSTPIKPNIQLNLALIIVLALVGGFSLAFLVDYLDNSIKTQEQIESILSLPFLGIIPVIKAEGKNENQDTLARDHHIIERPRSSVAECCRAIRTNLLFMSPERPVRKLLVTSSGPREGKSTTAVNLAVIMSQSGNRVLIVDTDMRRPRLHKTFRLNNHIGISNVIVGEYQLEQAIQPSGIERLDILPCGPIPPNPAELLHTESFHKIVQDLDHRYDRILFDSPPVAAVADALILSSLTDGIVLVVEAGQTSIPAANSAKKRIQDIGGRVLGVILNDLEGKRTNYYHQYQNYYYIQYSADEKPSKKMAIGA